MAVMRKVTVMVSTTLLTLLLLPLPVFRPVQASPIHPWRYIFPFFPEELDILVGHLRTTVTRLQEVLEQCENMIEGEWEGGDSPVGVMRLSAPDDGNGNAENIEEKVDRILALRENISDLEDKIEECRFRFWTGAEDD